MTTSLESPRSLRKFILSNKERFKYNYEDTLALICYTYYTQNGFFVGTEKMSQVEAVSYGLCLVLKHKNGNDFRVCEPLLIKTIQKYLDSSVAERYFLGKLNDYSNNNSTLGFKLDECIAWRFCELNGCFKDLDLFKIPISSKLTQEQQGKLSTQMKSLPNEDFKIIKVENGQLIGKEQKDGLSTQDGYFDPNTAGSLYYYLSNWDNFLGKAILPDTLSGPDVCVLFLNVIIFISIALRAEKVETDKLVKNNAKTNPKNFYKTKKK